MKKPKKLLHGIAAESLPRTDVGAHHKMPPWRSFNENLRHPLLPGNCCCPVVGMATNCLAAVFQLAALTLQIELMQEAIVRGPWRAAATN